MGRGWNQGKFPLIKLLFIKGKFLGFDQMQSYHQGRQPVDNSADEK
jgi:hypothetical protein